MRQRVQTFFLFRFRFLVSGFRTFTGSSDSGLMLCQLVQAYGRGFVWWATIFFFCALCVCMCVCVCVCEYAIVGTVTVGGCALSLSLSHREYGIHSGRGS